MTIPKKMKKQDAAAVMYDFYNRHEKVLNPSIGSMRNRIIQLLMDGCTVGDAFAQASAELKSNID